MSEAVITWGVALVLLLAALVLAWQPLTTLRLVRRRDRLISRYGLRRLDNVVLEDGIGGYQAFEHILLTADGLMVLLPRHCDGSLFGGDSIDSWTLMAGGKSFHFENPLHPLDELLATLRFHLPGIPLEGRVLFSGDCRFPKGRPGRILLLEELAQQVGRVEQTVVPVLDEAWQTLQAQPRAEGRAEEPAYAVSPVRLWLAALLSLLAMAWLVWHLS